MTLANLEGRKTRTSRTRGLKKINENPGEWRLETPQSIISLIGITWFENLKTNKLIRIQCPFGQVGRELYGKETYTYVTLAEIDPWKDRAISDGSFRRDKNGQPVTMIYRADKVEIPASWASPMMMPEWASRYHIILEKIICQRIQDITEEDCIKEGVIFMGGMADDWDEAPWCASIKDQEPYKYPSAAFGRLWDSINLKTYPWSMNPWAWGLYYRVVKKEIR